MNRRGASPRSLNNMKTAFFLAGRLFFVSRFYCPPFFKETHLVKVSSLFVGSRLSHWNHCFTIFFRFHE